MSIPAHMLSGLDLGNGWKVGGFVHKPQGATGGNFSSGYDVTEVATGRKGFLKALDFSRALQSADPPRALQSMTESYNYERDVLHKCRTKRLDKVVHPILDGTITVPNMGLLGTVHYLIFDFADGDVRTFIKKSSSLDVAWIMRSLHHTAVGMKQLHWNGIAHQDIKPSNVLVFDAAESKLSDFGRSSDKVQSAPHDGFSIPGDPTYAPPELFYGYSLAGEFEKRFGIDLYSLGSLIFFYFSQTSAIAALRSKIKGHPGLNRSGNTFEQDLPVMRNAFADALTDLKKDVERVDAGIADEVVALASQLCDPDPRLRGDPQSRKIHQFNLERYISKFNALAAGASMRAR